MERLVRHRAHARLGALGGVRAHNLVLRWAAPLLIMFCMAACGGGGGGGGSTPPAANQPLGGGSAPPSPGGNAAEPTFSSDFFEFPAGVPTATIAADLDNDGRMDIVVLTTDHFSSQLPESKAVNVFYQRVGGLEGASVPTAPITEQARSLAACDIDGDGKKEILVGYNGADLRVHKLGADGTPLPPTTLDGVRSFTIDCLDLDGDGKSDVVTSGKVGFDVQVLLQRNGSLTEVETFPTADAASAPFGTLIFSAIGDINGDGKPDIVFTGFDRISNRQVLVAYLQIDGGRFIPIVAGKPAERPTPAVLDFPVDATGTGNALGINSFVILDLFSNGMRNIVAAVGGNQPNSRIVIATYASNGQLVSTSAFPTSDIPVSLRVADVDGDGRNDIVVYHNGHSAVGVHYQNFNGSFREEQQLFISGFGDAVLTDQAIVIGDFDANGKRDIVLGSQSALFFFLQD